MYNRVVRTADITEESMPIFINFELGGRLAAAYAASMVHGVNLKGQKLKPSTLTAAVNAFRFGIVTPRDVGSGKPGGRRQHAPLTIIKETSPTSPRLLQAALGNETFKTVQLNLTKTNAKGTINPWLKINLIDASIVGVRRVNPPSPHYNSRKFELEEIEFAFQKIEYSGTSGGAAATDDWNNP